MASLDRLARRLTALEQGVAALSAAPQLATSSIMDGAVDQVQTVQIGVDDLGNPLFEQQVVARVGRQDDGSNTLVVFDGPTPPAPSMPDVVAGAGVMTVVWDGSFEGGAQPFADFLHVAVHAGTVDQVIPSPETVRATISTLDGAEVVIGSLDPGEYIVSLVTVAQSGAWSEPATYRLGGPGTSATLVDVQAALDAAQDALTEALSASNAAAEARRRGEEAAALAQAVSAAANIADNKAIDAARLADVTLIAADGKSKVTYSLNPPGVAAGGPGDTWFQVDAAGVVVGFWECAGGDEDAGVTLPPVTPVTPAAPTFVNMAGTDRDEYTIPTQPGVTYLIGGSPVAAGRYTDRSGPVAVVATSQPGFVIPAGAVTTWVSTLATDETGARETVTVADPTFTDVDGTAGDTVTLTAAPYVTWWVNGVETAAGVRPGIGSVTVEARPDRYHTLGTAQSVWQYTFDPFTYVTPPAPTFTDAWGAADDTYTIPDAAGVVYQVAGEPVPAGTYPASGTVTVNAVPGDGYAFTTGAAASWSKVYSSDHSQLTPVAATDPTFTDPPGVTADTYTIPAKAGVVYKIDGATVAAGTYPGTGAVVVTAEPASGYTITGTSSWSWTFSTTRTPVTATPPSFVDVNGTASDTVTIPTKTGVTYKIGGTTRAAGTYPATGTVTVTAEPSGDAYTVTGTVSWTFTYDASTYITPAAPTFTDQPGTGSDTVTIPTQTGVNYLIGSGTTPAPSVFTDQTGVSFTQGNRTSSYHVYAAGRSTASGLLVWLHGDGAFEYNNPNSTYVMGGTQGVKAIGAARDYIVVNVKAPDISGTVTWWENATRNATWLDALLDNLTAKYGVSRYRLVLAGFSGGAQFITETFVPTYSPKLGGVGSIVFGGGGAPLAAPNPAFTTGFKQAWWMHWATGALDDAAHSEDGFDALGYAQAGAAYYQSTGFTTSTNWIPGKDHVLDGMFGGLIAGVLDAKAAVGPRQPPGVYPASGTVAVTAAPTAGYAVTAGATTTWARTYTTEQATVTPVAPTFTDPGGTGADTVTIPSVAGVAYTIGGAATNPGTYPASGAVTVTAAAANDGYTIAAGATTTWSYTFDARTYVTPAAPTFNTTAKTYTIPVAASGTRYLVGGVEKAAGTYAVPGGSTAVSTTAFTAADNTALPAPWVERWKSNAACNARVYSNAARLHVEGAGNYEDKVTVLSTDVLADIDVTYTINVSSLNGQSWHHFIYRVQGTDPAAEPSSHYDVMFERGSVKLYVVANWVSTVVGSYATGGIADNTAYRVRVRAVGGTHQVRFWPNGQTEPADWTIEASNTKWTGPGWFGFNNTGGQSAAGYNHSIDDVAVTNPSATGASVTVTVTADILTPATTAFTAGATTTWSQVYG